jgi:large repetitive protein
VAEDGSVTFDPRANDSKGPANESGQTLTVTALGTPAHGTAAVVAGGVKYTPDADYNGPDGFSYTVTDDGTTNGAADAKSDSATASVTVTEGNDKPVAVNDAKTTAEDTPLAFAASSLATNDSPGPANESGQTLTVTSVQGAVNGSVSLASGQVTFAPDPDFNGAASFTYTVIDNGTTNGAADPKTDTATVNVTVSEINDPPDAVNDSASVAEDSATGVLVDVLANDTEGPANEGGQTLTISGVGSPSHGTAVHESGNVRYTPAANYFGPDSFTYTITDDGTTDGAADPKADTATVNITVTAVNDAPDVTAGPNVSGNEGAPVSVSATFSDVEAGDTHTCSVNWGDSTTSGGTVNAADDTCTASHTYVDDNPTATPSDDYTVTVTITDDGTTNGSPDAKSRSATLKATIANVAPAVTNVSGPPAPVAVSSAGVSITTNFTDAGSQDTHHCTYAWDDGTPDTTVIAPGTGNGSCSASHTYAAAGVYTVGVTVADDDTGTATAKYEFVVVYDPSGGFVTGGGWINSAAGSYRLDPALTGKANFGFVSKYKKGATAPEGQTEFQFHAAGLNFHSEAYQWLVVAGSKAQYKGTGEINGVTGFGFLLTATDGSPDKFRIKIWKLSDNSVVYDNKFGTSDDIDAADPQAIASGSIVVHK